MAVCTATERHYPKSSVIITEISPSNINAVKDYIRAFTGQTSELYGRSIGVFHIFISEIPTEMVLADLDDCINIAKKNFTRTPLKIRIHVPKLYKTVYTAMVSIFDVLPNARVISERFKEPMLFWDSWTLYPLYRRKKDSRRTSPLQNRLYDNYTCITYDYIKKCFIYVNRSITRPELLDIKKHQGDGKTWERIVNI